MKKSLNWLFAITAIAYANVLPAQVSNEQQENMNSYCQWLTERFDSDGFMVASRQDTMVFMITLKEFNSITEQAGMETIDYENVVAFNNMASTFFDGSVEFRLATKTVGFNYYKFIVFKKRWKGVILSTVTMKIR